MDSAMIEGIFMDKRHFSAKEIDLFANKITDIKIDPDERWAIYGTGNSARLIYMALNSLSLEKVIKYIIDRDTNVSVNKSFNGVPVRQLSEVCDCLDGIIVAAVNSHYIIMKRIFDTLTEEQIKHIRIIDIFVYNTKEELLDYVDHIEKSMIKANERFVRFDEEKYVKREKDTKVIAWYLPQFHQIEINNKFHGQGFTEWSNTSRAIPMFTGHYQPHIPYDVGYYDLLNIETLKRQIYLAKHYGIYGFCIHYYWFSGKKLMEKPLEMLLGNKELDIPFCLDWATENWTALWDGGNKKVMMEQRIDPDEAQVFMEDILPYMKDHRYIKIDGRPILVIYRLDIYEKVQVKNFLQRIREIAQKSGFPDLFIMITNAFCFEDDVKEWGGDALVEYHPHLIFKLMDPYRPDGYLNPYFKGKIVDVSSFVTNKKYMLDHTDQTYFRSALTSWDNTARKAMSNAWIFHGFDPDTFKQWLKDIMLESKRIHSKEEDIIFVNSWNEWAEGSHLEPDMRYGYAYLQVIKDVLEEIDKEKADVTC